MTEPVATQLLIEPVSAFVAHSPDGKQGRGSQASRRPAEQGIPYGYTQMVKRHLDHSRRRLSVPRVGILTPQNRNGAAVVVETDEAGDVVLTGALNVSCADELYCCLADIK